jgi:hypothetical protein
MEIENNTYCYLSATYGAVVNYNGANFSVYYYPYHYNRTIRDCYLIETKVPLASGKLLKSTYTGRPCGFYIVIGNKDLYNSKMFSTIIYTTYPQGAVTPIPTKRKLNKLVDLALNLRTGISIFFITFLFLL